MGRSQAAVTARRLPEHADDLRAAAAGRLDPGRPRVRSARPHALIRVAAGELTADRATAGQFTAGQFTTGQLRTLGEVSRGYGRDAVAVSERQDFHLRWIRAEDTAEVIARLRSVGLDAALSCGGVVRSFLGSPVAGIAADEIIDGTPALTEIRDRRAALAESRSLPRGFTTAVSGSPRQDVLHEASDISFIGVRHPGLGPGFDVRIGAGQWAGRPLAGRLGAFATLDEVPAVWAAAASALGDYGYRRLSRPDCLTSLVTAAGADRFRRVIEADYLCRPLPDGPVPLAPAGPRDHIGVHPQNDGRWYVGLTPADAPARGSTLAELAGLAEAHGSARVRTTPYQKLIILDILPALIESLCAGLESIGLTARPCLRRKRETARGHGARGRHAGDRHAGDRHAGGSE